MLWEVIYNKEHFGPRSVRFYADGFQEAAHMATVAIQLADGPTKDKLDVLKLELVARLND